MALFQAIAGEPNVQPPGPANDFWFEALNYTQTGIRVTPMSAMKASSAYACIKVLAETIATLPRQIWQKNGFDGSTKPALDHPLQDVIDMEPNSQQTAVEFWEMQIAFGALFGNSYCEIVPGARGAVDTLWPLRPDYMRVNRVGDNKYTYEYTDPFTLKKRVYVEGELFRIPGFSFNGVEGIAPIFFAADPIGLALATEAFGAKFFSKDATPALVLEHPGKLKPEAIDNIKSSWKRQHAGLDNAYSVAVMEEGMKVNTIGVKNIDAQFLETRRYQIAEIARYFRIPLHMINELEKATYSNIEQQSLEFLKFTLRPWLRRIEQRINSHLITNNKIFFVKHDVTDLLVAEIATRYAAWAAGINAGWLTRNEVRIKEGLNPLPGLDAPLTPLNLGGDKPGTPAVPKSPSPSQSKALTPDYQIIAQDAFERIVSAETDAIKKLAAKYEGEIFALKVDEYYKAKLSPYIVKALTPYHKLCASMDLNTIPPEQYAEKYALFRIDMLTIDADAEKNITDAGNSDTITVKATAMAAGYFNLESDNEQES